MAKRRPLVSTKPAQWALFLEALAATGNVSEACRQAKLHRQTVYHRRHNYESFALLWQEAEDIAADALEAEARRRAIEGWDEPVFYQGVQTGVIRKYSDALLQTLLKGWRPERYKDRQQVDFSGSFKADVQVYRIPDNGRD